MPRITWTAYRTNEPKLEELCQIFKFFGISSNDMTRKNNHLKKKKMGFNLLIKSKI